MLYLETLGKSIKNMSKKELIILWFFGVLSSLALIILQNKNKLPLAKGDFVFLSLVVLLVSLYRPRWIFFLFVMSVPLENIILAGGFLPVQLRPYQFLGAILILAVAILHVAGRLKFKWLKPRLADWLVFLLVPFSFLPLLTNSFSRSVVLKNNLILLSFVALYWLARNFLRNRGDFIKTAAFFFGSALVVGIYGFWQVFADKFGAKSFEVMFGRPNSVFAEPDWLGIFLCFALAALLSAITYLETRFPSWRYAIYAGIFFNITLLILTLSRSAWVGAAAVLFFYLLYNLFKKTGDKLVFTPKKFGFVFLALFFISLVSASAIHFGGLSKFDIFDRARSATTSEQKITVACEKDSQIPAAVGAAQELAKFGCKHINLEDIESQKAQGKVVAEVFRTDPNVATRAQIYKKSLDLILRHPLAGVGYGSITQSLGVDERGAGLNESNIFLQVWAGSGLPGLIAFAAAVMYLLFQALRRISPVCPLNKIIACPMVKDAFEKSLYLFSFLGIMALVIPNLFNAGLFMGIFWLSLALFASIGKFEQ